MVDAVMLDVPPFPRVVREGVFDAWGWCRSDVLEWRRPTRRSSAPFVLGQAIRGDNPPGLVFVLRDESRANELSLPCELARLHAFGYGLEDERALAPYGIDDATDRLYERRARPHDVFWLAASSLEALVWGLHDWAHFHNHGPFDEPAMTELQCDLVALAWLRANAERVGVRPEDVTRIAAELAALARRRFVDEGAEAPVHDFDALFAADYPANVLG